MHDRDGTTDNAAGVASTRMSGPAPEYSSAELRLYAAMAAYTNDVEIAKSSEAVPELANRFAQRYLYGTTGIVEFFEARSD